MNQAFNGQLLPLTSTHQQTHYERNANTMKTPELKYIELLQLAEQTTSRKEAIYLIRQAGKIRDEITSQHCQAA